MEPTSPNGGSKGSIMNSARALRPMNGTITPVSKLTEQLEIAVSSTTNQKKCIVLAITATGSIGKSLIATAWMLKIDLKWIRI